MSYDVVDPAFFDAVSWADETLSILYDVGILPRLEAPELWAEWAAIIVEDPIIAALGPPHPDQYADWQEWALQFNEAMTSRSSAA